MIIHGDSLERLKLMDESSVDSVVTDPPYGWRFMGKAWDAPDIDKVAKQGKRPGDTYVGQDGKTRKTRNQTAEAAGKYDLRLNANQAFQEWTKSWALEALRVLKPGGHILVFCGPRTYHRMASGLEDAGFEIRDQLQWLFGSGFPKSQDISKAIDKQAGAEREVVGFDEAKFRPNRDKHLLANQPGGGGKLKADNGATITAPATEAAKQWQGWGTALKPANEPICLARKPLEPKLTVAANVLKHGTGGLNIDASRIGLDGSENLAAKQTTTKLSKEKFFDAETRPFEGQQTYNAQGRWPANLILDEDAAAMLDEQSGVLHSRPNKNPKKLDASPKWYENKDPDKLRTQHDVSGGASRFFYVAKASKKERGEGNNHPTVKPIKLMEYLVKMITPGGGIVLDPFMGSGTTGVACKNLGFQFIGIEMNEEYVRIADKRIG